MNKLFKTSAMGALALAMTSAVMIDSADAQSRRRAAGIGAAVVIGGLIAGAAIANSRESRERVYVRESSGSGCGDFRRRAQWNEQNGNRGRAQYWWDRYEDCRGG
jgi:hypothetical protein